MRILLIGNYPPDAQESMLRFGSMMQRALAQAGHQVRLIAPQPILRPLASSGSELAKLLGYVDKFLLFLPVLRREAKWADIVHICDHSNACYVHSIRRRAHVVTCHDVLAIESGLGSIPQNPVRWSGRKFQRMTRDALRRARHIACVSDATLRALLGLSGFDPQSVSRIYNGQNAPYAPMPPEIASAHLAKLGIPADARFILHIGGNNWYKNRIGALRIFNALRRLLADPGLKLVMAGKPLTDALLTEASQLGLDRALLQITSPSDGELNALYSSAMLLLFPSLGEGFGWPIIEAQACGCPVVTSARPPMDEIAGSGAIFIDPSAPEAAASVIAGSLSRLDQLRDAGLENARRFDVNQMSLAYIRLYENIMHRQAGFDWCPRTDSNGPA